MPVYHNPAMTVDIAVLTFQKKDLHILLIQRKNQPFQGQWALPGGFLEPKETLDHAATRELAEETGVKNISLSPIGMFDKVDRDPRGRTLSMAYWSILSAQQCNVKAGSDASRAKWFSLKKLPELAFDHEDIIQKLRVILRQLYQTAQPLWQVASEMSAKQLDNIFDQME